MDKNTIEVQAKLIKQWADEVEKLEIVDGDTDSLRKAHILIGKIQGMQDFIKERRKLF